MKFTPQGALLAYSVVMTTLVAGVLATDAIGNSQRQSFDEIDVKRLNIREDDGKLRMVISSESRFPGLIMHGKEHPHPNRKTAGILFFNEEGTENGGLSFGGKKHENGMVTSGGHLSFDQYDQDQVVQLTHSQQGTDRWAALVVSDRPDAPLDMELYQKTMALPDGPAKQEEIKRLGELFGGKRRMFVGKDRDRNSAVVLNDAQGRARMRLQVSAEGEASIQFLDENGRVLRTVAATEAAAASR
jgi:hypothetical protein